MTFSGVIAAAATPLDEKFEPRTDAYIEHLRFLLDNGCDGINVLGTTGEANSLSLDARAAIMGAVAGSGLPMASMMVGTGACALADAVRMTETAAEMGFSAALVLPPFYYKPASDEGLFAFFARLIERAGGRIPVYLYNFPQMTGIVFSSALIGRLIEAFPGVVQGMKDSSGDMDYAATIVRAHKGFIVFPSTEDVLATARGKGYAGCISASVNASSALAGEVWRDAETADVGARQARLSPRERRCSRSRSSPPSST